jgi:hypothetical protein
MHAIAPNCSAFSALTIRNAMTRDRMTNRYTFPEWDIPFIEDLEQAFHVLAAT